MTKKFHEATAAVYAEAIAATESPVGAEGSAEGAAAAADVAVKEEGAAEPSS